jgi:hypothetical protein
MKYSFVASLLASSTVVLGELVPVHFKAPSPAHFREVVRNDTYDFGTHGSRHDTPGYLLTTTQAADRLRNPLRMASSAWRRG